MRGRKHRDSVDEAMRSLRLATPGEVPQTQFGKRLPTFQIKPRPGYGLGQEDSVSSSSNGSDESGSILSMIWLAR